jgi:hypothetical protein
MATWATSFWQPSAVFRARNLQPIASTAAVAADADPLALPGLPNDDVFLWSKQIDNSRLVRQVDTQVGTEWTAIGGAGIVALLVGCLMIAPGVSSVMDSYKIQDLKREQAQLRNEQRKLDVQEELMINAALLDKIAPNHNLARPAADQVIRLQPKNNHSFAMNGFKSQ